MRIFLLLVLVCLGLPVVAAEIVPDPFAPARLTSLYLEKDESGTQTSVQLAGDAVVYKVVTNGKLIETTTVQPSPDDWFLFIQRLNQAKVYKWAPKYYYPGQGASWLVELATDDRKFESQGTNEYPREDAESQPVADPKAGPSIPFQLFWQAALGLVGKAIAPPAK